MLSHTGRHSARQLSLNAGMPCESVPSPRWSSVLKLVAVAYMHDTVVVRVVWVLMQSADRGDHLAMLCLCDADFLLAKEVNSGTGLGAMQQL